MQGIREAASLLQTSSCSHPGQPQAHLRRVSPKTLKGSRILQGGALLQNPSPLAHASTEPMALQLQSAAASPHSRSLAVLPPKSLPVWPRRRARSLLARLLRGHNPQLQTAKLVLGRAAGVPRGKTPAVQRLARVPAARHHPKTPRELHLRSQTPRQRLCIQAALMADTKPRRPSHRSSLGSLLQKLRISLR